jgi:hypothetical protein
MVLYASTTADDRTTLAMYSRSPMAGGHDSRSRACRRWAGDGRLVYAREDGNLMAVPLDVAAMGPRGAAVELRERVAASGSAPGWRSEAGTLVYRAARRSHA